MSDQLYRDLSQVAVRHMETVSGPEFQRACLDVALGYFDDTIEYHPVLGLAEALARELEKLTQE